MRGATSSDGKMTGNVQTVGRYDEHKKAKPPSASGGESGGERDPEGHDELKQVVGEHGAAHEHVVTKTEQGHHSKTTHSDGHVHHADHASLDEAHEHGKVAMEDAEHNTMGEDAAMDAGERGGPEMPSHKSHAPFMT
jgi:hypothetical protein